MQERGSTPVRVNNEHLTGIMVRPCPGVQNQRCKQPGFWNHRNRVLEITFYYLKEHGTIEEVWKVSQRDMDSNLTSTIKQVNKNLDLETVNI